MVCYLILLYGFMLNFTSLQCIAWHFIVLYHMAWYCIVFDIIAVYCMSPHCILWYGMVLYFIWSYCTVSHCYVPLLQRAGELPRSASSHFTAQTNKFQNCTCYWWLRPVQCHVRTEREVVGQPVENIFICFLRNISHILHKYFSFWRKGWRI